MPAAAKHKARLIDTAITLFRRQGYAATGLNQIVRESGAPKGSLYHYFPGGKEALGAAAVASAGEVVARTLRRLQRESGDAAEFIQRYCALLTSWMEDSGFHDGCPIATTVLETCPDSEPIREAAQAAMESWLAIMEETFDPGGGDRRRARTAALLMISAVEGALVVARTLSSPEPIDAVGRRLAVLVSEG